LLGDIDFAKIKRIIIKNTSNPDTEPTQDLDVGVAVANGFVEPWPNGAGVVPAGGVMVIDKPEATGWVVDATHKLLKLHAQVGAALPFTMQIVGVVVGI